MAVPLPYYSETAELPSPLPTLHEITTATIQLPTLRHPDHGRIAIIREYAVKYGTIIAENEGNALIFIERHLAIPAPRLYAMYRHDGKLYLVMQHIPGTNLGTLWPQLSADDKQSIARQLRVILDCMRALPPSGTYGDITGGRIPHRFFCCSDYDTTVTGPFQKIQDFHEALARHSCKNWTDNERHPWIGDFLSRNLPSVFKSDRPRFTHSDLYIKNIIVERAAQPDSVGCPYKVAAIVDWETAGWYPEYWEYAVAFVHFIWDSDWPEYFEKFVDPWPLEATMLKFIHQDLEF